MTEHQVTSLTRGASISHVVEHDQWVAIHLVDGRVLALGVWETNDPFTEIRMEIQDAPSN